MSILFLEGDSGIGKSTLILREAAKRKESGAGFFSQRLVDEQDATKAFALCPYAQVSQSIKRYEEDANIFLHVGEDGKKVRMQVFHDGRNIIGTYKSALFLLMDEVGGIELSSPEFRALIYEMLASGIPCIGVIKSRQNYIRLQSHVKELREQRVQYEELRTEILARGGEIVTMSHQGEEAVAFKIKAFFKEISDESTNESKDGAAK